MTQFFPHILPLPSPVTPAGSERLAPSPTAQTTVGRLAPSPTAQTTVGRLAPSPTGHLHLGNAWAFLLAWLAARAAGGQVLLRMEDIDPDRSRPAWAAAIVADLHWLGLDWDAGYAPDATGAEAVRPTTDAQNLSGVDPRGPFVQSARADYYYKALQFLIDKQRCYPCYCTRKELRALAGAPHVDDRGAPYPGTCRHLSDAQRRAHEAAGRRPALRLRCPDDTVFSFDDALLGRQTATLRQCGGDFALRRSDGVIAYQLAVVVDDAMMGVNQIVRGRDIAPSTPRQLYLQHLLHAPTPVYAHVPLLCDADGERLAKRHQSLSLRALRESGVSADAVVGLLACLAGLRSIPTPCAPAALLPDFAWEKLPRNDVRLTPAELAYLR